MMNKKETALTKTTRKESKQQKIQMQKEQGRRAKNFKGTLKILAKRLFAHKYSIILALLFAGFSAALLVIGPFFLKKMMELIRWH